MRAHQTHDCIFALIPRGDVEEVGLVVVEQELDDHPVVLAVVLDGDHPHDVGRVLGVGVLRVLVGEDHNRIRILCLDFIS